VAANEIIKRSTSEKARSNYAVHRRCVSSRGETAQALIEAADACLYAAKRVICETDLDNEAPSAD
jgi:hypothetical protein